MTFVPDISGMRGVSRSVGQLSSAIDLQVFTSSPHKKCTKVDLSPAYETSLSVWFAAYIERTQGNIKILPSTNHEH